MALSGLIRSSMSRAIFTQVLAFYDEGTVNLFANLKMGCMAALPLVDVNLSIFIYTLPRHRAATLPPRRTLTMYAITGITGQVGGALARTLLAANKFVSRKGGYLRLNGYARHATNRSVSAVP
jgi:hypothetical protein